MSSPQDPPATFTLAEPEILVVWAAMLALVKDNHCAQDQLTPEQRQAAHLLLDRLTSRLENPDHAARKERLRQRAQRLSAAEEPVS